MNSRNLQSKYTMHMPKKGQANYEEHTLKLMKLMRGLRYQGGADTKERRAYTPFYHKMRELYAGAGQSPTRRSSRLNRRLSRRH